MSDLLNRDDEILKKIKKMDSSLLINKTKKLYDFFLKWLQNQHLLSNDPSNLKEINISFQKQNMSKADLNIQKEYKIVQKNRNKIKKIISEFDLSFDKITFFVNKLTLLKSQFTFSKEALTHYIKTIKSQMQILEKYF